ncbi:formiminoglutamase [Alteribacillus persepolensis]|uniref:Formiminoglutamase n=1 Tax=Alteribacillus persepolensis TaxID=568899 RepID=A0A1G8B4H9_9BACI|nr:agmatinase family protein [Alteribacillus persepolensis]SDH28068.1 formiminoglutamase [Alteribacillus persepolensis]
MSGYPYPMLDPPSFVWTHTSSGTGDMKVHQWVKTAAGTVPDWSDYDVTIIGVPLSKSSISSSSASENPDAMRRAWKAFYTYNIDEDIDLQEMKAIDLGNVKQHVTDIAWTHERIQEAMAVMRIHHPHTLPVILGGDHSITAMLVKGYKQVHTHETVGILQFDSHFDVRDPEELGKANGTPIRVLIDSGTVKGAHVYNIGVHGFFNGKTLKDYADKHAIHYMTMKQARQRGISNVTRRVLLQLCQHVDAVYVTIDMDVLDITHHPAAPASAPGGMYSEELFEAAAIAGACAKVKAVDIVCSDPRKDVAEISVKTSVQTMLSFLTGYTKRLQKQGRLRM